jgi:two-component system, chemotaxis family, response regulator Rcp1
VEDNPADVGLIREALQNHGMLGEVTVFRDGEQAMDFISHLNDDEGRRVPGLVLLDLNLPKVRGEDILVTIRKSERFRGVPVIVLTSSDAESDRRHVLALGATAYIPKPSELEAFLAIGGRVAAVLRDSR